MTKRRGLVVDLDRCIGCFACQVACKQEHGLAEGDDSWIHVETLGPFEVNGEPAMDFVPFVSERCDFCADRTAAGRAPFCVQICPTQALALYDEEQLLRSLRAGNRIQICKTGP